MGKAYLLILKETYEEPEKYIFLDQQKANDFFEKSIKEAFKINETEKDDDGRTLGECLLYQVMESDPYTATLEEITLIN